MNILKPKVLYTAIAIALPASALSVSITIEDDPVNYGTRAKPNVLLVVDDSVSMDVETGVTGTHEGYGYWNEDEKSFVISGKPASNSANVKDFTHLFPLGMTADSETTSADIYDGKHIWVENIVPPLDAYGFFRHANWNPAYYNPAITYDPWPSYAGHVWPDIDPKKAWFDAGLVGGATDNYLDLTVSTTRATNDFDYFSGMWCYDSASYCPTTSGDKPTEYWAATYYVDDKTSTFTVDKTLSIDTVLVDSANAIVIEAEAGALSDVDVVDSNNAGQGKYVEFSTTSSFFDSPPATNEVALNFSTTATTAEIWVRRRMPDSGSDSFWVSLDGHDSTSITTSSPSDWSGNWHKWWQGHTNNTAFIWEQWGTADLNGAGSYTLRIRQREDGVGLDQVAIVVGSSPGFTDNRPLTNKSTGDTYSCADPNVLTPGNYTDFHSNPQWFSGVDAFGPDGRCLERVEIKSTRTDYPSGRTYTQELQNFANWFTYHRKRHQATRGALGSALQGIGSIRAGLFWINNRRTIEMFDLDEADEREGLLDDNYYYIGGSGKSTPNKEALVHAGEQLDSNADIIQYACQKNYALHFTDGYTSGGSSASVGNVDGAASAPYQDSVSNSLADIALHYYQNIPWENNDGTTKFEKGKVPVPESCTDGTAEPWVDCRTELHMNTYTVGLGLTGQQVFQQSYDNGTISGVYESVKDAHAVAPTWPTSIGFNGTAVDDLYHAAVNGRGDIFSADNPTELKDQLQSAMRAILAAEGSASGLTFNTATLSTKSLIFSAKFNTTNWTGELTATNLDPETGIPENTAWSVQEVLDKQSTRSIITYDPLTRAGIPFQWSNLQTALLDDDLRVAPDGNTDSNGELRLKYLRGDRSNEGTLFRERSSLLGDIVNSSPVYVGPAVMGWPSYATNNKFGSAADNYSDFAVTKADVRTPMVYVSANDGMVHGFNASDSNAAGREEIAYIPSAMYSTEITQGLHYLTDPDYEHRFYVDGEPVYSDVYVTAKGDSTKSWRTILAGAYRGGAKGLYALDITDPSTFAEGNAAKQVLFEYGPDSDTTLTGSDPDLGYLHEPPLIGMLNDGQWAIIFGNGFNSTNGEGAIYVGYLDKIIKDGWELGVTYDKFKTNRAGAISGITGIDIDSDMVIDMIYASDAAGHIWRLDLEGTSGWGYSAESGGNPDPLFTATNDAGEAQPILVRPRVVKRSLVGATGGGSTTDPDRLVIFGTGQMLQKSDLSNKSIQSFYVFHDQDLSNLTRNNLSESTMTQTGTSRDVENTSVWQGAKKDGFYVDFDVASEAGERVIDYIDIRRNSQLEYYALFSTVIPEDDPCSYGGRSWVMAIDLASGGTTDSPIFDTNGDGVVDDKDTATAGMGTDNFLVDLVSAYGVAYGNTSEGNIETFVIDEGAQLTEGRLGWQELINRN